MDLSIGFAGGVDSEGMSCCCWDGDSAECAVIVDFFDFEGKDKAPDVLLIFPHPKQVLF
jgi:hypothetical protein